MDRDFNQVYMSPALNDFKNDFKEKWKLEDYNDINAPLVFFGMYGQPDYDIFMQHRAPIVVVWGGNDMHEAQIKAVKQKILNGQAYTFVPPGEFDNTLNKFEVPHKTCYIPNKDYSKFKPTPLGENVYVYLGRPDNFRPDYFKYHEVIEPLMQVFGEERIKWVKENNTLSIDELTKKYYNDCFCFVKPNDRGGVTSMYDLAHMGRMTIGKGESNLPNFKEYSDINNLIELVIEESKYIGKVREDIASSLNNHFLGNEWLTFKFWE